VSFTSAAAYVLPSCFATQARVGEPSRRSMKRWHVRTQRSRGVRPCRSLDTFRTWRAARPILGLRPLRARSSAPHRRRRSITTPGTTVTATVTGTTCTGSGCRGATVIGISVDAGRAISATKHGARTTSAFGVPVQIRHGAGITPGITGTRTIVRAAAAPTDPNITVCRSRLRRSGSCARERVDSAWTLGVLSSPGWALPLLPFPLPRSGDARRAPAANGREPHGPAPTSSASANKAGCPPVCQKTTV
jgi:hypothetical protein